MSCCWAVEVANEPIRLRKPSQFCNSERSHTKGINNQKWINIPEPIYKLKESVSRLLCLPASLTEIEPMNKPTKQQFLGMIANGKDIPKTPKPQTV
jgi:hypothetical protein